MTPRRKRMVVIGLLVLGMGLATALILRAFNQNLMYFYSTSEVAAGKAPTARDFRIGGLVVQDSLQRQADSLTVQFVLTDLKQLVTVRYTGILPDLFKEGKGVVAQGELSGADGFKASEVLAKHDENYMPPEAQHALDQAAAAKAAKTTQPAQ